VLQQKGTGIVLPESDALVPYPAGSPHELNSAKRQSSLERMMTREEPAPINIFAAQEPQLCLDKTRSIIGGSLKYRGWVRKAGPRKWLEKAM